MPSLDVDLAPLDPCRRRWLQLERRYMEASWYSREAEITTRAAKRSGAVLLSAPHAGTQTRDRWAKPADAGTGSLCEVLAEISGCAAVTVSGLQRDDPNWDLHDGTFRHTVAAELATNRSCMLLDIHGMRDIHRVDVCLGLGPNPSYRVRQAAWRWLKAAQEAGLSAQIDYPFNARKPGTKTMTNWAQTAGIEALQIELGPKLRDPRSPVAARSLAWLQYVIADAGAAFSEIDPAQAA